MSTDEQNEWQAPQSAFEDEPMMMPEYLPEPPKKMPVIKQ